MLPLLLPLLLLSHFSRVRLCVTPQTAAHQAPPSLGFSRQEHWSGLPFPSPMHESEEGKWSCSVVSDSERPMDCSPPGSSHGIFQARVLEWGVITLLVTWNWGQLGPGTPCYNACPWTSVFSSNKIQRNYKGPKVTVSVCNWGTLWTTRHQKTNSQ